MSPLSMKFLPAILTYIDRQCQEIQLRKIPLMEKKQENKMNSPINTWTNF
jgi:hypothetical protein